LSGILIGLAIGIVLAIVLFLVLYVLMRRGVIRLPGMIGEGLYSRILVASMGRPFSERSLLTAIKSLAGKGYVEILYILEIGLDHPLDVPREDELDKGMKALDKAVRFGTGHGTSFIPRLEKVRMGSKAILDLQAREGFDLVVMDLGSVKESTRDILKIAEYVRERAGCTVLLISGG
jgi:nucleotide-binding universal stress UspA family protein